MKKILIFTVFLVMTLLIVYTFQDNDNPKFTKTWYRDAQYSAQKKSGKIKSAKQEPSDWFYLQRAYPNDKIPDNAYINAYTEVKELKAQVENSKAAQTTSFLSTPWVEAGPTNIPGRIPCIAIHPSAPATIYAGSAAGGVFKSVDFGVSWTSIFDDEVTLSIGAIAIHPTNPNIIYVGTGEANTAGDTYEGVGIYKSVDAGATWTNIGLPNSARIGRIVLDPLRPDSIYVAVLGKYFGTNPERGVYRSFDGGSSWEQALSIDDSTGCIDIVIDSASGTLVASMWSIYRDYENSKVGGITCGIYKSINSGDSWNQVLNGLPAPADSISRIGLAIEQSTSTIYSMYVSNIDRSFLGIYKSVDLGDNWVTRGTQAELGGDIFNGFGWYFGQIRVAPNNPDRVYALGVQLYYSSDGGLNWTNLGYGKHADHHDIYIDPANSDNVYNASDGGMAYSTDAGFSWAELNAMPSTQFYAITIDPNNSDILYGGTQDNGSMRSTSVSEDNWEKIGGGDGFYVEVDHTNSDIIYAEYQWGQMYKIENGSSVWAVDWTFYNEDRHNWNSPFAMDPQNSLRLYYGSNKMYQTNDGAVTWQQKSDDLTNGPGTGNRTFGTLTTIGIAPSDSTVVYVGANDGNVWVTQNADASGMFTWTNISATLPLRWISRVTVDPYDPAIAYVTLSGYKVEDLLPHIFRTTDYGANWISISGNLPDFPINDVVVDPDNTSTLYIGTDFGAFYTTDLGVSWNPLGTSMPIVPIHDLVLHNGDRKLVAGTHGRSMYSLDLSSPGCCIGIRGNVDGDINDQADISDLVYLVDFIFVGGLAPVCLEEADLDGVDNSINIDMSDLVLIVDFIFSGGAAPNACP